MPKRKKYGKKEIHSGGQCADAEDEQQGRRERRRGFAASFKGIGERTNNS